MAQLLVRVDDDVAGQVRRLVKETYGGKRGALSMVVEQALRDLVAPPAQISSSTLLEVIDHVARAAKEDRPKDQILANIFIMLDQEFEQSVARGTQDVKRGRVFVVPKGEGASTFLRRLASRRS